MSKDDPEEEFCYKENAFFPRSEFSNHPVWGRVHNTTPSHTTLGTDLDDDTLVEIHDVPPPQDPPAF